MKAEDFMIGDWVFAYGKKTQIVWVGNIHKMAVRGFPSEFMDGEIEPIPLTPEILEKNGFTIKKKWAQMGNFGDSPLIMWHFEDNPILKDFKHELEIHQNDTGKVHVRIPCEFVHELQHAFRLCRINKDIVL